MARPKGSKNKSSVEIEKLQQKIFELEKTHNSYDEVVAAFVDGFVLDLFNKDIIKHVSNETLQKWFSNPDENMDKIIKLLTYNYIIDGNIFQLYDLIFSLPTLEYNITVLNKDKESEKDLQTIKYFLEKKVRHKELTRDLAVQLASNGTLIGTWLGTSRNPYFYTFDDLQYIYPYGRYRGQMVGVVDLKWLDSKTEEEQNHIFNNLSPLVTPQKYQLYRNNPQDKKLRLITLPVDKSFVERIHTLNRNQRLGVPFGTQALFDMQHKQKLKDLEIAIANKIIRAIAVLKFNGKDENEIKVSEEKKKKVYNDVKRALERNVKENGITCIGIPDFASFDIPDMPNTEQTLSPDKYKSIDNDISSATGISPVISNGTNGNFSSASLNLSVLYKRIGILLEKIENIYNQLIDIILGKKRGQNYIFSYNTEEPLTNEKKLDALMKLQQQGYSTKAVLDRLGLDAEEYFKQSIYEIESLKLRKKIIPPQSTYTLSEGESGAPAGDNKEENDDGNKEPSPSDK